MRNYLKRHLETLKNKYAAKAAELDSAGTVEEIRAIDGVLKELRDQINEVEEKLAAADNGDDGEGDGAGAEGAERGQERSGNPLRDFITRAQYGQPAAQDADPTNRQEYRSAFMSYVMRGTPIPMNLRENTLTTDVLSVIPTVVINKIIERMEEVGTILNLVTRTSYAAGVEIPTSTTKPVATWVSEGAGSDKQKKSTSKITFTYFKLRCEVSVSMEVHTMALDAFESKLAENVAKAMVKAIEAAIINGTGVGQPKGILAETPNGGQAIDATDGITYEKLCEVEAAVPAEYEASAKWCMTKKNFMACVALTDSNGQPIARVNYGISGKPERYILGREVVVSECAPAAKPFVFDFTDYILNTIYDMGIQKKQDWDTEDLLTKAVMSVDGKAVNKDSLVTMDVA